MPRCTGVAVVGMEQRVEVDRAQRGKIYTKLVKVPLYRAETMMNETPATRRFVLPLERALARQCVRQALPAGGCRETATSLFFSRIHTTSIAVLTNYIRLSMLCFRPKAISKIHRRHPRCHGKCDVSSTTGPFHRCPSTNVSVVGLECAAQMLEGCWKIDRLEDGYVTDSDSPQGLLCTVAARPPGLRQIAVGSQSQRAFTWFTPPILGTVCVEVQIGDA